MTLRVLHKLLFRPPTLLNQISKQIEKEVPTYHLPSCGAFYALGAYTLFKAAFPLTGVVVSCSSLLYVITVKVCNYQVIATENLLITANYFHIIETFVNFVTHYPLELFPTSCTHCMPYICSTKQKALQQSEAWSTLGYVPIEETLKVIAGAGTRIKSLSSFGGPSHFLSVGSPLMP